MFFLHAKEQCCLQRARTAHFVANHNSRAVTNAHALHNLIENHNSSTISNARKERTPIANNSLRARTAHLNCTSSPPAATHSDPHMRTLRLATTRGSSQRERKSQCQDALQPRRAPWGGPRAHTLRPPFSLATPRERPSETRSETFANPNGTVQASVRGRLDARGSAGRGIAGVACSEDAQLSQCRRRVVSCHIVVCRIMSRHLASRRVASGHVAPCLTVSRRVVSCRVVLKFLCLERPHFQRTHGSDSCSSLSHHAY